jgi:hypothetical protein
MMKTGFYRYDPTNYHGPLHFYILFLSQALFGRHIWALRLPVVLASIGSIFVTLKFEPFVGRTVSRIAALAMAISPAFIFYGRYSIHEVWLLLFSMLFVLGLFGLWRLGYARLPLVCWHRHSRDDSDQGDLHHPHRQRADRGGCPVGFTPVNSDARHEAARRQWDLADLAMVTGTAIFLVVFFYSGTFFNWPGLKGLYLTFATLVSDTGSDGQRTRKAVALLARAGDALRMAGLYRAGPLSGVSSSLGTSLFAISPFMASGSSPAYSIIHYKTPWIIISIVWPLLFVFAAELRRPKDSAQGPSTWSG